MCASSIDASPCRYCTFRLLASSPVPLVSRATHLILERTQLVEIDRRLARTVMPQAFRVRALR